MSVDFIAACFRCRKHMHVGQYMAARPSLGFGAGTDETTMRAIAAFVLDHDSDCGSVTILNHNDVPDTSLWIPLSDMDADEPGYGRGGVEK